MITIRWADEIEMVTAKRFFEIVDEVTEKGWHLERDCFGADSFMVCYW